MKNIVIDATGINNTPTGLGKYSYYLLKSLLRNEKYSFTVLINDLLLKDHPILSLINRNVRFHAIHSPVIGPKRELKFYRSRWLINQHDLYHCLSSYLPGFGIHIPTFVTIHDLKYLLFPEFFKHKLKPLYYNWIIKKGMFQATYIIAVSKATKEDIASLGVASDKIKVIYEAPTISCKEKQTLPDRLKGKGFFLFVGENRPHKNVERIITAFKEVKKQNVEENVHCVFVGTKYAKLAARNTDDMIIFMDVVDEPTLCSLYKYALALVYPSLYEGFGLPILEAMQLHIPVITSDCSSMPEVAGNAALFVDPRKEDQIASAMLSIINDPVIKRGLIEAGMERVKCFSWEKAAGQVSELYDQVLTHA